MKIKHKRFMFQMIWNVAASVFLGICVYGLLVYWGEPKKISPVLSVGLGLLALGCILIICFFGTVIDKIDVEIKREIPEND